MSTLFKLTDALPNQSGLVLFTNKVSSAKGLAITFNFFSYGGTGADGFSFFFIDGAKTPTKAGAFGGSLGYAQRDSEGVVVPGLVGGYLGIGFDEYGGFSEAVEGRVGGPGFTPDSIAVRGSEAQNYKYLAGTQSLPSLDFPGANVTRAEAKRTARIEFSAAGVLTVRVDFNQDGDFLDANEVPITNLNVINRGNGALPSSFRFGFAASTGDETNIHEVGNFNVTAFDGSTIPGDFTNNRILVGSGLLEGTNDNDDIRGDVTNDELRGLAGNDTLTGNAGNDRLLGSFGRDVLRGGAGLDTLSGGTEDDLLYGGAGNDALDGGGGNDQLYGEAGNDRLLGGAGRDILSGGLGSDVLAGGGDADQFVYSGRTQAQALKGSTLRQPDRITGFRPDLGDRIKLDFNNNLATIEKPAKLFFAGKRTGRNLRTAAESVFADRSLTLAGKQTLQANQAVFFQYGTGTYLAVNDATAGFSPTTDLLINVSGMRFQTGDLTKTALQVGKYFA